MKGWLIYSQIDAVENASYIQWFIDEAKKQDIVLKLIRREDLTIGILEGEHGILLHGKKTDLPTFAIVRTVEPILNDYLERLGIQVFNSHYISRISNHKALTYTEVAKLGIPIMDTIFIKGKDVTEKAPMDFPFVIKDAYGRGGKQVYYIKNNDDWNTFISNASLTDYVVQVSDVQLGKDLRVFVIGKEIIAAVLRESNSDFRANFKLGGTAKLYDLNQKEVSLLNKIIYHFDFGMVGIDFLISHDGQLIFNEIEDVVGSRTLSAVSNINILEKYVTYIKSKIKRLEL